ncbi:MAG TPA: zinc ribbon domain-containing protein [Anaerolineales bacterium]|nr:zinc ribbon domain-containing protein [Anaerolineales bacterium]
MSKKTIGHVELIWVCPNCGTRNGGLIKSCTNCGAPQPENVKFVLDDQARKIEDHDPAGGPDIHCPYCHTRNPAGSKTCISCGGDLTEGIQRTVGQPLSETNILTCPECGFHNPPGTAVCQRCGIPLGEPVPPKVIPPTVTPTSNVRPWMFLPVIAIILLACSLIWLLFFKTSVVYGVVTDLNWQVTTPIEVYGTIKMEDWRDQIPSDGIILSCSEEVRGIQDMPAPNSKEICTTEIVDSGDGTGAIVESCVYEVYDYYCSYNIDTWYSANSVVIEGNGAVTFDLPATSSLQRYGTSSGVFNVVFETEQGYLTYSTASQNEYQTFNLGSEWMLSVNNVGEILEISQ